MKGLTTSSSGKAFKKASTRQILVTCHILYYLCQGQIPLPKEAEALLKKKRKFNLFQSHFNSTTDFQTLLKSEHAMGQVVIAFKTLYKVLFHYLFVKG